MEIDSGTFDSFDMYANSVSGPGSAATGADTLLGNDLRSKPGEDSGLDCPGPVRAGPTPCGQVAPAKPRP